MLKTHREKILIRTSNCDLTGSWRLSDILATMQEVSGMHSHLLGVGRDVLLAKNIVWVLTRSELVMDRYPVVGETITVETFPMNHRRMFFPRYFIIYDEAGEVIGKFGTLWVLMDFIERKMVGPEAALGTLPDNSDLTAPLGMPGNIGDVEGEAKCFTRTPVYSEIDVNQHVNNTRYADWLCDALGIETMKEKRVKHLLIHYMHEVLPGQEMSLSLYQSGDAFRLAGECNGNKHFEIGGELEDRGE